MTEFDVYNPLKDVTPRFTEEKLEEIIKWFNNLAKPRLILEEGEEAIKVVTIAQLKRFLEVRRIFHKRSFHYPHYGELMAQVEYLKADIARVLTRDQVIYILDSFILEPEIRHELTVAFRIFDTEERGFFDIEQLQTIVTECGDVFTAEECIEFIRDANVYGHGNVYYEDFIESLFKVAPELYKERTSYLYDDPDEDISVPPDPVPEPEAPPPPPPPPPPPEKKKRKGKGKGKK